MFSYGIGHRVVGITNGHSIHAGPSKGTGASIYLSIYLFSYGMNMFSPPPFSIMLTIVCRNIVVLLNYICFDDRCLYIAKGKQKDHIGSR